VAGLTGSQGGADGEVFYGRDESRGPPPDTLAGPQQQKEEVLHIRGMQICIVVPIVPRRIANLVRIFVDLASRGRPA
jgi:hypothetical protein